MPAPEKLWATMLGKTCRQKCGKSVQTGAEVEKNDESPVHHSDRGCNTVQRSISQFMKKWNNLFND